MRRPGFRRFSLQLSVLVATVVLIGGCGSTTQKADDSRSSTDSTPAATEPSTDTTSSQTGETLPPATSDSTSTTASATSDSTASAVSPGALPDPAFPAKPAPAVNQPDDQCSAVTPKFELIDAGWLAIAAMVGSNGTVGGEFNLEAITNFRKGIVEVRTAVTTDKLAGDSLDFMDKTFEIIERAGGKVGNATSELERHLGSTSNVSAVPGPVADALRKRGCIVSTLG